MVRQRSPVIVLTGTPGTGKSTHAQLLMQDSPIPLRHLNIGELVRTYGVSTRSGGHLPSMRTSLKIVADRASTQVSAWVFILISSSNSSSTTWNHSHPSAGLSLTGICLTSFPNADLVVVLRYHHTLLWGRLEKRYVAPIDPSFHLLRLSGLLTQKNNEAEIMNIVSDEAKESYQPAIIVELESNTMEDLQENVSRTMVWIDQRIKDNSNDSDDNNDGKVSY